MFKPKFNQVLVEIDDIDSIFGTGNDDSFAGESFREGKMLEYGQLKATADYPSLMDDETKLETYEELGGMLYKTIMWNEGHEAGKVFKHDGKKYALISWFDIVGVKEDDKA